MANFNSDITESTQHLISEVASNLSQRADAVEQRVGSHDLQVASLQAQQMAMDASLWQLHAAQLAIKNQQEEQAVLVSKVKEVMQSELQATDDTANDINYDAPPAKTLFRLHVNEASVTKAHMQPAGNQWPEGGFSPDVGSLDGEPESKRFSLKFT